MYSQGKLWIKGPSQQTPRLPSGHSGVLGDTKRGIPSPPWPIQVEPDRLPAALPTSLTSPAL